MHQVPTIVYGRFKLFERNCQCISCNSHLSCLCISQSSRSLVTWYPGDLPKRAKIHSVLDWHHSNLRHGAAPYIVNTVLAPALGLPLNPQVAADAEKILNISLSNIESIWLELGAFQPSITDLSLVCEIMQLQLLDEKDRNRILGPHKKVQQWIEDTRKATSPHFDEVHTVLFKAKARLQSKRLLAEDEETESNGGALPSKL